MTDTAVDMHFSTSWLLLLGLGTVLAALLLLYQLVRRDLAPAARLTGRRRWLLMAALGAGVIAFSFKLAAIATITGFSQPAGDAAQLAGNERPTTGRRTTASGFAWAALPGRTEGISVTASTIRRPYVWQALPDKAPAPDANPTTPQKVSLGRMLFNDPQLSHDGSLSCASCHELYEQAGADGRATARGIENAAGPRNTPTVWNAAFQSRLFWDGRAGSLEQQASGPLLNPLEMGMPSPAAVEERVRRQQRYAPAFAAAFGPDAPVTIERITQALAAYQRTLITADTPYDRFVRGDRTALTGQQIRGMALFESLGCVACHHGPNFSAASVFDDSAPLRLFPANPTPLETEFALLGQAADGQSIRQAWRVPSLRNVALTGPWLHNGQVAELGDVVRIMAAAQLGWSGRYLLWSGSSGTLSEVDRPVPSEQQVDDIVAFLHALSSDRLIGYPVGQ